MSKLTKEERREMYKSMLKLYEEPGLFNYVQSWEGGDRFFTMGLCAAMYRVLGKRWLDEYFNLKKDLPELVEKKYSNKKDFHWWDRDEVGYLARVSLLFTAIKRTEL